MAWLTLLLFLPWFGLLGTLYWCYPRTPRDRARRLFDAATLLVALALSIAGMLFGFADGGAEAGERSIWRHVLAVLYAYGGFLIVLAFAIPLRARWLHGRMQR
ncbi:hypothetical protein [Xanthomonas sp. XNM01]|jgi:hypothetical protein|uniref:hypothetical protein n=1 Tax=Xanthomonas sp. XNM01 TaxID=2769289 RepID=UPI00177C03B5|nr:hypothetical protein [Xanthomonas sp. XNM01]MBD9369656.1 hypothetical protein [Xanthomonas sp. XNM01]